MTTSASAAAASARQQRSIGSIASAALVAKSTSPLSSSTNEKLTNACSASTTTNAKSAHATRSRALPIASFTGAPSSMPVGQPAPSRPAIASHSGWPTRSSRSAPPRDVGNSSPMQPAEPGKARVVLVGGPSGAGKSRLATSTGLPIVSLDDFYRDGDDPALPRSSSGLVDWDDPRAWHADAAVAALSRALRQRSRGRARVRHRPRRRGRHAARRTGRLPDRRRRGDLRGRDHQRVPRTRHPRRRALRPAEPLRDVVAAPGSRHPRATQAGAGPCAPWAPPAPNRACRDRTARTPRRRVRLAQPRPSTDRPLVAESSQTINNDSSNHTSS